MPPPKKNSTVRRRLVRIAPEPPDIQDVLKEIEDIKSTLDLIQYTLAEINRKIDALPDEIERS